MYILSTPFDGNFHIWLEIWHIVRNHFTQNLAGRRAMCQGIKLDNLTTLNLTHLFHLWKHCFPCFDVSSTLSSFIRVHRAGSQLKICPIVKSVSVFVKNKQGKQCFQRWNRCVRFKVVRLSSLIPLDLRHAEQLLFLCPCSNLTVYKGSIFDHPLCASLSCLQYGI